MPLYDVTGRPDMLVEPQDAASYELLTYAKKEIGNLRFDKDCRIIDAELKRIVSEGKAKNKLVFTKAGFITGHSSKAPHVDVQHVWDSAEMAFPTKMTLNRYNENAGENQLKFIGGLVRWRISLLDDTWLVYRQPSGTFNKFTGKEITISEYWINDDYIYEGPVKKKSGLDLSGLSEKWGARL